MISALHLLWIVPLSASIGFAIASLLVVTRERQIITEQQKQQSMKTPENCDECENSQNCMSYYGGDICKHKEVINQKAIDELLGNKKDS